MSKILTSEIEIPVIKSWTKKNFFFLNKKIIFVQKNLSFFQISKNLKNIYYPKQNEWMNECGEKNWRSLNRMDFLHISLYISGLLLVSHDHIYRNQVKKRKTTKYSSYSTAVNKSQSVSQTVSQPMQSVIHHHVILRIRN